MAVTISANRFHTVGFFSGAFLNIAYLLAFAAAFDDRAEHGRALYYTKETYRQQGYAEIQRQPFLTKFYFELGSGSLDISVKRAWQDALPDPFELAHGGDAQGACLQPRVAARLDCNSRALSAIARFVDGLSSSERLRVTLIAHADSGPERLNWELTRLRAAEVHRQLMSWLGQRRSWDENAKTPAPTDSDFYSKTRRFSDVDYVELAVGSQKMFWDPDSSRHPRRANAAAWRQVEVKIETIPGDSSEFVLGASLGGQKTLLDYVMNYALTASGRPDMIPMTPFTKFLNSISSLVEILFWAIFINAILSLPIRPGATPPAAPTIVGSSGK